MSAFIFKLTALLLVTLTVTMALYWIPMAAPPVRAIARHPVVK